IREIDVAFEDVGRARAAVLENRNDILQRLDRLFAHIADADDSAGLVPGDLAGGKNEPAAFRPRRIGIGRTWLEHQRRWTQNLFWHGSPLGGSIPPRSGGASAS